MATEANTIKRCKWCEQTDDFIPYHDNEWGFPVKNDQRLFEKLCLESFQSGLSWRTILAKRDNFRHAFAYFDFNQIALFDENDRNRLLQNQGIVRHKGKIDAVINNAQKAQILVTEFGSISRYVWQFEPPVAADSLLQTVSTSPESVQMAKDLKKRGWKFVGPTTVYAFMQAMGLINDHAEDCVIRPKALAAKDAFIRPV